MESGSKGQSDTRAPRCGASSRTPQTFVSHTASESEVWFAEDPDHKIHFNGERFLGPYPKVMPTKPTGTVPK